MTKQFTFILLFLIALGNLFAQDLKLSSLGKELPGKEPKIFAPGFISLDNRIEGRGSFSPDGSQFYFTVSATKIQNQKIFYSEYKDNEWTKPDTAAFSKKYANWEPFFSADGQKLFFTSNRNKDTLSNHKDFYYVTRIGDGWSEAQIVEKPINSQFTELFFSQSKNGNIYFTSNRPKGKGSSYIYFATKQTDGTFLVTKIGRPMNRFYLNWDPCIAPDESFLIFPAVSLFRISHKADLYITYKSGDHWIKPKNLGKLINTKANEYGPFLSPDKKFLFFIRLAEGQKGDIYWVAINTIKDFNKQIKLAP
jgi:Tol biopolymer transport system component